MFDAVGLIRHGVHCDGDVADSFATRGSDGGDISEAIDASAELDDIELDKQR